MTNLEAAGFWIGLNAILLLYLGYRVAPVRRRLKVSLGDGGEPELVRAIRTQANYVEYAPVALIALLAMALLSAPAIVVHAFGGVFLAARVAHLVGFGMEAWAHGRFVGTLLSMLTLVASAAYLIFLAVG